MSLLTSKMERIQEKARTYSASIKTRATQPSSWALPRHESSVAPPGVWSNLDYDPVPVERQTWTSTTVLTYWFSDLVSIVGWSQASAMYAVGLSAADATLACMVAGICISFPIVLNGRLGAMLHVPFPMSIRASFGTYLQYFCVVSRAILALFWFGVHSVYGGDCVTAVVTAIWPSYARLPNHLPASAGFTTKQMVSYVIYHCFQTPCLFIRPHKLKYLFRVKVVLLPPMIIATVIWLAVKAGGGDDFFHRPAQIHGAARAWQWLAGMTSVTGGCSTLALNNSDWSRFSKKPSSQFWQFLALPLFLTTVGLCGIVGASASEKIWGTALWNPLDIVEKWNDNPGGRAAAFFSASCWLLAQVSINLSTNSVAFATDIGTLAPKWLNIRRASFLGFLIGGWALCPWIILKSAQTFLNFMSAYSIFMAPITGVLLTDFYLIKKQKYDVPALYDPKGIYYYQYGCNWRALAVLLIIIVPLLPPMAHVVNANSVSVPAGLTHLYDFNWLYGFTSGSVLYYILNRIFPYRRGLIPEAVLVESSIHGHGPVEGISTQQSHDDVEDEAAEPYANAKLQSEVAETFAKVA